MQPETGTLAAVVAEENEVHFFLAKDYESGTGPTAEVRVGATPCSVAYKRYGDKHVFAVVCSQDSHLYLFNADGGKEIASHRDSGGYLTSFALTTNEDQVVFARRSSLLVVDADFSKLVYDNGNFLTVVFGKDALEKRCLPGA